MLVILDIITFFIWTYLVFTSFCFFLSDFRIIHKITPLSLYRIIGKNQIIFLLLFCYGVITYVSVFICSIFFVRSLFYWHSSLYLCAALSVVVLCSLGVVLLTIPFLVVQTSYIIALIAHWVGLFLVFFFNYLFILFKKRRKDYLLQTAKYYLDYLLKIIYYFYLLYPKAGFFLNQKNEEILSKKNLSDFLWFLFYVLPPCIAIVYGVIYFSGTNNIIRNFFATNFLDIYKTFLKLFSFSLNSNDMLYLLSLALMIIGSALTTIEAFKHPKAYRGFLHIPSKRWNKDFRSCALTVEPPFIGPIPE